MRWLLAIFPTFDTGDKLWFACYIPSMILLATSCGTAVIAHGHRFMTRYRRSRFCKVPSGHSPRNEQAGGHKGEGVRRSGRKQRVFKFSIFLASTFLRPAGFFGFFITMLFLQKLGKALHHLHFAPTKTSSCIIINHGIICPSI